MDGAGHGTAEGNATRLGRPHIPGLQNGVVLARQPNITLVRGPVLPVARHRWAFGQATHGRGPASQARTRPQHQGQCQSVAQPRLSCDGPRERRVAVRTNASGRLPRWETVGVIVAKLGNRPPLGNAAISLGKSLPKLSGAVGLADEGPILVEFDQASAVLRSQSEMDHQALGIFVVSWCAGIDAELLDRGPAAGHRPLEPRRGEEGSGHRSKADRHPIRDPERPQTPVQPHRGRWRGHDPNGPSAPASASARVQPVHSSITALRSATSLGQTGRYGHDECGQSVGQFSSGPQSDQIQVCCFARCTGAVFIGSATACVPRRGSPDQLDRIFSTIGTFACARA